MTRPVKPLKARLQVRLPSGSCVRLVSCRIEDKKEIWTCAYADRVRGEVELTGDYLRRHAIPI